MLIGDKVYVNIDVINKDTTCYSYRDYLSKNIFEIRSFQDINNEPMVSLYVLNKTLPLSLSKEETMAEDRVAYRFFVPEKLVFLADSLSIVGLFDKI